MRREKVRECEETALSTHFDGSVAAWGVTKEKKEMIGSPNITGEALGYLLRVVGGMFIGNGHPTWRSTEIYKAGVTNLWKRTAALLLTILVVGCEGGGSSFLDGGEIGVVSAQISTQKNIVAFSLDGITGVINEAAKTIAVTVPNGTDVSALIATFTTTGINVKVGTNIQTSTATANDFTSPVSYTVTAADSSTATYIVIVTIAPSTAKAITAFSFAGYSGASGSINEAAKTIAVTVPNGTDVSALIATFTTTGINVRVGAAIQTSASSANDFTGPVSYTVTAADASTATYIVTVSMGAGPPPVILGLAGSYAVLADSGITNATIPAAITGDIGVGPGVTSTAITGFALTLPPSSPFATSTQVNGKVYAFDYAAPTPSNVTTASADSLAAYNDAVTRTPGVGAAFLNVGSGNIGGLSLPPGTYTWNSAVTLPFGSNVTLSGGPNDVWIFQVAGALTTGANTSVLLSGGALPANIFWQVAGASVTLGASAHFEGVVLAKFAINLGSLASANGRLLSQTAVTLDQSIVTQP